MKMLSAPVELLLEKDGRELRVELLIYLPKKKVNSYFSRIHFSETISTMIHPSGSVSLGTKPKVWSYHIIDDRTKQSASNRWSIEEILKSGTDWLPFIVEILIRTGRFSDGVHPFTINMDRHVPFPTNGYNFAWHGD